MKDFPFGAAQTGIGQDGHGIEFLFERHVIGNASGFDLAQLLAQQLCDFGTRLELGLQESVRTAVEAGFGVTFISRSAIEAALAAGTLTEARIAGLEPSREIFLARAAGRTLTRVAQAFLDLAHERLR